jgi:hypothetical protein
VGSGVWHEGHAGSLRHALIEASLGRVLVDPMLRSAGMAPPIEGTLSPRPNPLVELLFPGEDVVAGVDLCVHVTYAQ